MLRSEVRFFLAPLLIRHLDTVSLSFPGQVVIPGLTQNPGELDPESVIMNFIQDQDDEVSSLRMTNLLFIVWHALDDFHVTQFKTFQILQILQSGF